DLLAVAVAVGERGVDEVEAEVDRPVERAPGFVVARADPLLGADAPGAVAHLRDPESGASQRSVVHGGQSYHLICVIPAFVVNCRRIRVGAGSDKGRSSWTTRSASSKSKSFRPGFSPTSTRSAAPRRRTSPPGCGSCWRRSRSR